MAEILGTVYSNAYNSGDYYMWEDGNPNQEDRSGFFVTTCVKEGQICIKKCLEQTGLNDDLFGVTVASAAFVGGQEYITGADDVQVGRDYRYSLVVATGVVPVRCKSDVKAGDYVSMNIDGVAKTVDESFGYKVVEIKQIGDVTFATIILSTQGDKLSDIYTRMVDTNQRLQACTENMVVVANVATEASNIAHEVKEELAEMGNKVGNMSGTLEGMQGNINDLQNGSATNESVAQLREEVKASITQIDAKTDEVAKEVNGEDGKVNKLIKAVEPLTTWTNGDETGAQYLVDYIKDGVATKTEVDTASSEARNALAAVEKNALGLQSLVSSISIYSVGAFSQANGFSLDDAISVMEVGMVYVPTVNHSETYVRDKIITINGQEDASECMDGGTLEDRASRSVLNASPVSAYDCTDYTIDFIRTHSYVWNGLRWDDTPNSVWFIEEYVEYDGQTRFWYTGDSSVTNPKTKVVYAPETLYEWRNDCWVAVATTKHNATAKMINLVRQTADAFSVELVNARGSTASLDVRLNDDEAKIQTLTKWQGETNESIASISQTASENHASIELVVGLKDNERVIKAASIMAAVNKDESDVTIDADKINFYGVAQFNANGTTTINGSYITTGTIQGPQGTKGSHWDLATGKLVIKNDDFGTVIDGGCITTGTIDASKVKVTNLDASNITTGMIQSPNGNSYWNLATGELVISGYATTDDIPSVDGLLDENTFNMYKDAIENGTTTINGGCITTGVIDAQYLNLSGCLTVGDLDGYATIDDIPSVDGFLDQETFNSYKNAIENGTTTIDGGCITTGFLKDQTGNNYWDLDEGTLKVSGDITATEGYIGNFRIDRGLIYESEDQCVAIQDDYFIVRPNSASGFIEARYSGDTRAFTIELQSGNTNLYLESDYGHLTGTWTYGNSQIATLADLARIEARLDALDGGDSGGGNTGGGDDGGSATCNHLNKQYTYKSYGTMGGSYGTHQIWCECGEYLGDAECEEGNNGYCIYCGETIA